MKTGKRTPAIGEAYEVSGRRSNILLIMSDQHAPGIMGCAGDPLIRTPNLDRLAEEGMRFSNAYCPSPLCVPSRMSFMTGRTPSRNRVWTNEGILSSGISTWAHALGIAGYHTALIGRMHFLGPDQRHGFMERRVGERQARFPGTPELGGPRYTRFPNAAAGQRRQSFEYAGRGPSFYQHYDTDVTDAACAFLQERKTIDKPFAAVAGFLLPHCPYIGPKDLFNYYYGRVETSPETGCEPECIRALYGWRHIDPPATEHQLRVARAAYYAMIEFMDRNVGRILDSLERSGQADDTLVIYCSDHGDMLGEHGLWSKKCFYEQSAGIPLVARLPGVTAPGSTCDSLCSLVDMAPTFVELTAAPAMHTDGESLLPLMQGGERRDRVVTSEVADMNGGSFEWLGKMVRQGDWKLWQHHRTEDDADFPPVLFNLADDPGERRNLADDPGSAEVRAELLAHLQHDWRPSEVIAEVRRQVHDWRMLCAWGNKVRPEHPDTYVWPGEDTEAELELL